MVLRELHLQGLLSFGPDSPPLELRPLNVLIGPNGSGKSNFIDALDLLRSAATNLTAPMRRPGGGGVTEWLWQGATSQDASLGAVVDCVWPMRHRLTFGERASRFQLSSETVRGAQPGMRDAEQFSYYVSEGRGSFIRGQGDDTRALEVADLNPAESILSQRRDPDRYPALALLTTFYRSCRLYREWPFGRSSALRRPQSADLPVERLEEDFTNLWLFLSYLREKPRVKAEIVDRLRDLYAGLEDFEVRIREGTVQALLSEGDMVIPASRLSDGTLRYLCLLAILCDPEPPALIGIEEPELGLHPDLLPRLAGLLVTASERTQLVVTTHSDILVDALSDTPESVVVVEKDDGQTVARRLAADDLSQWLTEYRLGQLWLSGQIGGTRW